MITPEEIYKMMPFAVHLTKDVDDAKDLLHDAYIKLHNAEYEERGIKHYYIKTAIYNAFIDKCRSTKKIRIGKERYRWIIEMCFIPDYEEQELTDHAKKRITKLINNLSDLEQKIWGMYIDGYSQKQQAEILQWNQNSVASVVHRIKKRILKSINYN